MRKFVFCIYAKTKAQISLTVDQYFCFHYTDSTIPLLSESEISSLYQFSVDQKPQDWFSSVGAQIILELSSSALCMSSGYWIANDMSRVMRKRKFCVCENEDADQLRSNSEADQCLCFLYTDSTIPLLPRYKIPSL